MNVSLHGAIIAVAVLYLIGCIRLQAVQLCAMALIVYGLVRHFVYPRVAPKPRAKNRAWSHLAVATLLACAAVSVFIAFDVWTSTKLDLVGATAHGSTEWIRDYTARYEFTTETGQVISAIRSHVPDGNTFRYLQDNPHVFKVKGSGRRAQVGFVLLLGLALWQFGAGTKLLGRRKPKPS